MTDEYQIDNVTWAEKDSNGNIVVNPDVVNTESVQNNVGSAKIQASWGGLVVPVYSGSGMADAINPANTTTPVNDAIDTIVNSTAGGGVVLLPPEQVVDDGPIQAAEGVSIKGWGVGDVSGQPLSEIKIGTTGADGIDFGARGSVAGDLTLDGFVLRGQGSDSPAASALYIHDYFTPGIKIGRMGIQDWYGEAILADGSCSVFQSHLGDWLHIRNVDAGDVNGLIDIRNGLGNTINILAPYPSATTSASNSDVLYLNQAEMTVNRLNIGGSAGRILWRGNDRIHSGVKIGPTNYEPSNQQSTPSNLVRIQGQNVTVGVIRLNASTTDNVYRLTFDNGDLDLARPLTSNGGAINGDIVNVVQDTTLTSIYRGKSTEVVNNTGTTLNEGIACLGDLTVED